MKLKSRHVFAGLVLLAEAPILATLVAGWLVSGAVYGIVLAKEHAGSRLRSAIARRRHLGSARHLLRPRRAVSG